MNSGAVVIGSVVLMVLSYLGAAVAPFVSVAKTARRAAALLAVAGALAGALAAATTLLRGGSFDVVLPSSFPGLALTFRAE